MPTHEESPHSGSPAASADPASLPGCPFQAGSASGAGGAKDSPVYRRPLGFLHHRGVRREIASLHAKDDCERIVYLLSTHEFPFDMRRALEVALFHTYGSQSVAGLLDRTGQFRNHGQKRYDDTNLLIAHFIEAGWQGQPGARAIARMNAIHGRFRIPNDDFLFVLWTFIDFPIRWMADYGWRALTAHEQAAWLHYWLAIGRQMGLRDLPPDKAAFDAFVSAYEAREMVPNAASARVADATVAVMQAWLPRLLRGAVKPAAAALARPALRAATGFPDAPPWFRWALHAALKVRRFVKRWISLERYPSLLADRAYRSYPEGVPEIEKLGPMTTRQLAPQADPHHR